MCLSLAVRDFPWPSQWTRLWHNFYRGEPSVYSWAASLGLVKTDHTTAREQVLRTWGGGTHGSREGLLHRTDTTITISTPIKKKRLLLLCHLLPKESRRVGEPPFCGYPQVCWWEYLHCFEWSCKYSYVFYSLTTPRLAFLEFVCFTSINVWKKTLLNYPKMSFVLKVLETWSHLIY